MPHAPTDLHDAAIVGGGLAGLAAALSLGRAMRRVAVVDAGAPRNAPAAHAHNLVGFDGAAPAAILAAARADAERYGASVTQGRVSDVRREGEAADPVFAFTLSTGHVLRARAVVLACGIVDELPAIAGLAAAWGETAVHCPYCHGHELRDRPTVVLGGLHGVHQATLLRAWSADVTLVAHGAPLAATDAADLHRLGVRVVEGRVARLVVEGRQVREVVLESGVHVPCGALYLRPPQRLVAGEIAAALGCAVSADGLLTTDGFARALPAATAEPGSTEPAPSEPAPSIPGASIPGASIPGVYVAGDATAAAMQSLAGAALSGSMAGAMANHDLARRGHVRAAVFHAFGAPAVA